MKIRKYLEAQYLISTIEKQELYFGAIPNYEDTDINEGRVTDFFLNYQKRLYHESRIQDFFDQLSNNSDFKQVFDRATPHIEQEAKVELLKSLLSRKHAHIQCWTTNLECDNTLWNDFADDSTGASIISSTSKIYEILCCYTHLENELLPFMGNVTYNRENLTPEDIEFLKDGDSYLSPCFALSGDEKFNYKHELEFRFLLLNDNNLSVDLGDMYDNKPDKINGNMIEDVFNQQQKDKVNNEEIFVNTNNLEFIQEIIMGSKITSSNEKKITEFAKEHKISIRKSTI